MVRVQKMARHSDALGIGQPVQGDLIVIGLAAPGGRKLRPVGQDEKHPGSGYTGQDVLRGFLRVPVRPMQVLDGQDQRPSLRGSEHNAQQRFLDPLLFPFGA